MLCLQGIDSEDQGPLIPLFPLCNQQFLGRGGLITRLKHILKRGENRQVLSNIFSLSGLQLANSILPLFTVPYIVRVIGPSDYGTIAFAQAFAAYFVLVITYGFDFTASREIAQNRSDMDRVRKIFWTVIWSRAFLFVLSTIVFAATAVFVVQVRQNLDVMIISYLIVIGTVTFPTWFFQGIEKLGLTAIFNFIVKIIFTAGVFVFLRRREQFIVVPLLLSLGQLVAGVAALIYAKQRFVGKLGVPSFREIRNQLKEGFTVFISTVFINFYTISNTVILAFFAAHESVGFFAGGSKIVSAVRALTVVPLAQAMFPHVGKIMKEDRERGVLALKKLTFAIVVVMLPASLVLLIFAAPIVHIILGSQFDPAVNVVRLIAFFPLIIGLSNVFGVQGLLNLKLDKAFLKIIVIGSVINLVSNCVLDPRLKEVGAAGAWLITELYITSALYVALRKADVKIADLAFYRRWLIGGSESGEI